MLATFVAAADRVGLGTCPISTLRNNAGKVSDLLGLPDHVFPVAGLGVGWPSFAGVMSPRLGLDVTIHHDRYDENGLKEKVAAYDKRRRAVQPYATQRHVDKFGEDPEYGWSEDKVRQYSVPDRADFGAFVRAQRFQTRLIVRFLQLVQHEKTQRARQIAGAAAMVDLGHQGVQRQAALLGDGRKFGPERVLQRDRGAMAVDCDRTFAHAPDCGSGRTPPQPALPPSQSVRISAPRQTPSRNNILWTSATSPSSPTSTMARPRWSTAC